MKLSGRMLFFWLAVAVLFLDQITKSIMTAWLAPRRSLVVLPGLFDLSYVRNPGAVFGLFRSLADPWRSALLTLVPMAAIFFVFRLASLIPRSRLRPLSALGLILGGAVGNLVDRIRLGSVIDFLDVYLGRHHWPAFNVADACICTGVGLLLLEMWRSGDPIHEKTGARSGVSLTADSASVPELVKRGDP
ncbi:MAG: signal peptidase II [Acidobacteriota bacterium]